MSLFLAILRIYERETDELLVSHEARLDTQPLFPHRAGSPSEDIDPDVPGNTNDR
jgi:hypothetical protein